MLNQRKESVDKLGEQIDSSVREYITGRFRIAECEHTTWLRKHVFPNLQRNVQNNLANCMMASCEQIGQAMAKRISGVAEVCEEIAETSARASHNAEEALLHIKDFQDRQQEFEREARK